MLSILTLTFLFFMKCIIHNDKDAVGQCNTCGCWLCKDCIHNFTTPICPECNLKWWTEYKTQINKQKIIAPIFWLIFGLVLLMLTGDAISYDLRAYPTLKNSYIFIVFLLFLYWVFGLFTYYWWLWISDLNKWTVTVRDNDWFMWIILRKFFKLTFALMIWIFVWPYKIYTIIQNNKEAEKMIKLSSEIIAKNKHHHS